MSTYQIAENGTLKVISASLPTTEIATCWSINGIIDPSVAYVANAFSGSISGFRFDDKGAVTPLTPTATPLSCVNRMGPKTWP